MSDALNCTVLALATLAVGHQAGLFYAYSISVMPGLGRASARTEVAAMQRINTAILNPLFFVTFLGAPVLVLATGGLHLLTTDWSVLPWIVMAFVLYMTMLAVTAVVNVPLNKHLDAVGPPGELDNPETVRDQYHGRWVRWNHVRTVTTAAAFGCLVAALCVTEAPAVS